MGVTVSAMPWIGDLLRVFPALPIIRHQAAADCAVQIVKGTSDPSLQNFKSDRSEKVGKVEHFLKYSCDPMLRLLRKEIVSRISLRA